MCLQLQLSMAAMAIGFHVTSSVQSVSRPNVFALNRESRGGQTARSRPCPNWTPLSFQAAMGFGDLWLAEELPTGSWRASTRHGASLRPAQEFMVWRQRGYSMVAKSPRTTVMRAM